ncbi:unnamed protein product [Litomosoides sigmodontis]|uniref:BTB domain-containing protein n=1 Tax=Litomosoides sigmodontis TaxID=42156 RepID=A0A3P6U8U3_LITSI|nr:unnamed protein product [Litomosoides sigmodontis]
MISCKIILANNNSDESIIISPKVRQQTAKLSASMDRNLLLRFNDGGMLVVHSQILAYYSARFLDNYRLNRFHMKIEDDARIARALIQFHYTGILQLHFFHIEKYFLIASKLAFDIALEALSQLLEKFSHRNDYHAIICANIACEPSNHVAQSCVKSIINCAASFLQQSISSASYNMYACGNAMCRILQIFAILTNWKKSLKLALEWLLYENHRYLYANSMLNAIIFEASDELTKVVKEERDRLPQEIGDVLEEHYNHIMSECLINDENPVKRVNPEKPSDSITEYNATPSVKSSSRSDFNTSSSIVRRKMQSLISSSETEHLLVPACSSTKIFHEFLFNDDDTQQIYTSNNADVGNDEAIQDGSEVQYDGESLLPLDEPIISNVKPSSYSSTLPLQFPDCTNIDYAPAGKEFEMTRGRKIMQWKLVEKVKQLKKFGFFVDVKSSDNAITV